VSLKAYWGKVEVSQWRQTEIRAPLFRHSENISHLFLSRGVTERDGVRSFNPPCRTTNLSPDL